MIKKVYEYMNDGNPWHDISYYLGEDDNDLMRAIFNILCVMYAAIWVIYHLSIYILLPVWIIPYLIYKNVKHK